MKQLRGLYAQTFFTFRTALIQWNGIEKSRFANLSPKEVGIARHSGQPELVDRDYEDHCTSQPPDGRSVQFDDDVQVDLIMHAPRYNIEPPSLPTQSAPTPESNVVVLVENSRATVEERRN